MALSAALDCLIEQAACLRVLKHVPRLLVCALPHSRPLLVGLPPALTHPRAAGHRPRTTKSLTRCHSPQRRGGPAPRRSAAPSTHLSAHASQEG